MSRLRKLIEVLKADESAKGSPLWGPSCRVAHASSPLSGYPGGFSIHQRSITMVSYEYQRIVSQLHIWPADLRVLPCLGKVFKHLFDGLFASLPSSSSLSSWTKST